MTDNATQTQESQPKPAAERPLTERDVRAFKAAVTILAQATQFPDQVDAGTVRKNQAIADGFRERIETLPEKLLKKLPDGMQAKMGANIAISPDVALLIANFVWKRLPDNISRTVYVNDDNEVRLTFDIVAKWGKDETFPLTGLTAQAASGEMYAFLRPYHTKGD